MLSTERRSVAADEAHRAFGVERWNGTGPVPDTDVLVVEEPLEIRVNDAPLAVTMRTPGDDAALAVGFLATEGIVRSPEDVYDVTRCGDAEHPDTRNTVTVYVPPERVPDAGQAGRQRYATSSCGLCGRAALDAVRASAAPVPRALPLPRSVLQTLPGRLRAAQAVFDLTGGLHGAGLFDAGGRLLCATEDIGRHNAVDKVVGRALLAGLWPLDETILMVSGRAGFEIVQKALAARIPAVASVSAASSLAAELATEAGMTLVGFLRGDRMTVYAGGEWVVP